MNLRTPLLRPFLTLLAVVAATLTASADDLRNVKRGEPMPACTLAGIDGQTVSSDEMKGSVIVYVCLSAEQRRSELAMMDSQSVAATAGESVKLIHVTADIAQKSYFEKFRQDRAITAPLAIDAQRTFYSKLGMIVFPTTVIVNKEGKLDSVISLHSSEYKRLLTAHIAHAMGTLSDAQLDEQLAARPAEDASPRSAASSHRALAKLMREKGQFDAAKAELAKGLELDKSNHDLMLDLAELCIATDSLDEADQQVAKVLTEQAEHRRAQLLKGEILFYRGSLDASLPVLEEALKLNPNPEMVHYYLGRVFEAKGEKDKALSHYREALAKFVHDPRPANAASNTK